MRLSVALDYDLAHAPSGEAFIIVPSIDGTGPEENQWHWLRVNGPVRPAAIEILQGKGEGASII